MGSQLSSTQPAALIPQLSQYLFVFTGFIIALVPLSHHFTLLQIPSVRRCRPPPSH